MSSISISDSKSNNTIDEPLFDQSLSSNSNSSNTNIRSIMKRPLTDLDKYIEKQRLKTMSRMITIITFIVVYIPIIAFNLYFAYTDNTSCVSQRSPMIGLTLYDYLTVQAYSLALTLALIILDEIIDQLDGVLFKSLYKNYILCYRVFSIVWISVGVIMIIFITYNRLCSNGIYYYVGAITSILAFSIIISIVQQYKEDYKLNNNST